MSDATMRCSRCQKDCQFVRVGPFGDGSNEAIYAVAWRCPSCNELSLDACPAGPVVPSQSSCLNCGTEYASGASDSVCNACGSSRSATAQFLHLEPIADDPVETANDLFPQGLHRRALAQLNFALALDPNLVDAWKAKAQFFQAIGYCHTARVLWERAIAAGGPPALLISLGVSLQNLGMDAEAEQVYERFLEKAPQDEYRGVALCNRANALGKLGRIEEAEVLYKEAIAVEPKRATHYFNYAQLLIRQRRWLDAQETLDIGLRHSTDSRLTVAMLEAKAFTLAEGLQGGECLKTTEAGLAIDPNSLSGHYLRGRALALVGRLHEARDEMKKVLSLRADHADATRALKMIEDAIASRPKKPWWRPW